MLTTLADILVNVPRTISNYHNSFQCVTDDQKHLRFRLACQNLCGPSRIRSCSEHEFLLGFVAQSSCCGIPHILVAAQMMLCHVLPIQFELCDRDLLALRKIGEEIPENPGREIARAHHEFRPLAREVVVQAEQQG